MKKDNWQQIEPQEKIPQHLKEWYFTGPGESITIKNKPLAALRGWGAWEINTLINILGYENKVTPNL